MRQIRDELWELKYEVTLPRGNEAFPYLENEWTIRIYQRLGKNEFTPRLFRGELFNLIPNAQLDVPEAPYDTVQFLTVEEIGVFVGIHGDTLEGTLDQALQVFSRKILGI